MPSQLHPQSKAKKLYHPFSGELNSQRLEVDLAIRVDVIEIDLTIVPANSDWASTLKKRSIVFR